MKKVAVILSGSGVFDGAEIGEAILTLLHISKQGAQYQCFAPDVEQMHTLNHINGEEIPQTRNVLVEAARIARGEIKPLTELNANDFDALILPGGFGAAKNLSTFATQGENANINDEVKTACQAFAKAAKPAGYMCIAPVIMPAVYGNGVKLTIGNDADTAAAIEKMGGHHLECSVEEIIIDETNKVVSTPAYMLANNLVEAETGIAKLVQATLAMCD